MLMLHTRPHRSNAHVNDHAASLINQWFDDAFFGRPTANTASSPRGFAVDVNESDSAFELVADLPGFNREAIQIDIEGDTVKITASVQKPVADSNEAEHKPAKQLRRERVIAARERSLQFAQAIDADKATATFEAGVLTLTLPKLAAANIKRVAIA
jgi:HSP20 family protein